ncbi:glycosyltransferase [Nocardia sp. alder85J]|uniref:glycosyltransferase n=1 Tax=Nocardia sp. alder85J TaxID=2862949 RepID=UPI001CD4B078|nr:glycosyltransferase [Nocardia sp. alder85J]MCX4091853.1 glycosyltransferase [Nocardia sp. alder85J]
MRTVLSTVGSRGEVQPMLALATRLRDHDHRIRVCAPPDFRQFVERAGFEFVPLGPELRPILGAAGRPSAEALRRTIPDTVAGQFETLEQATADADLLVGCGALQIAAPSIAEMRRIPYTFACYCPITLPSPQHAPIPMPGPPADATADNRTRWTRDARRWNEIWRTPLDSQRAARGLAPVPNVRDHVLTARPLLAADPLLGPWPAPSELAVTATGAWILPDDTPLPAELLRFLDAGEPPVFLGFGSTIGTRADGHTLAAAVRALGRRAVVSRGWADLGAADDPDTLLIGEVNQQALFTRVAAVLHHGGAGTTTTAARAGAPQVVVPHTYDQPYWAQRVQDLGIGVAHPAEPTVESLTAALAHALSPTITARARTLAPQIHTDGAEIAARYLTDRAPARA